MAGREKHTDKELEKLLKDAETRGCRVESIGRGRPFKIKCPCPDRHMEMVHRTPGRSYAMRKRNILEKWPCWERE
jgi:hypothetical protein